MTEERKTRTEVRWATLEEETPNGELTHVTLRRRQTVFPLTADGRQLWSRGETTDETFGPFAVGEVPDLIKCLAEVIVYYANGDRARDLAIERAREQRRIERL